MNENGEARATPGTARATKAGGSTAARQDFHEAGQAVTRRDEDEPEPHRSSSGETGKAFGMAARAPGHYDAMRATHRTVEREQFRGRYDELPAAERQPEPRGSGELGKAFGEAARAAMQRVARVPTEAYAAATAWLSDTLDWLNLWEANGIDDSSELDDGYDPQQNYPSPHL